MKQYNPKTIELKWQRIWQKQALARAKDFSKKPKFYCLVEFPYPSGDGLHVGHLRSYSALDAVARQKRMQGYNVLYPMGWDAFGLPTENYAIKTGVQPQTATRKNVAVFKKQIKRMGLSFDWSREINTTDPKYYKWTQWIFLQLFRKGLAYQKEMPVNWCPSCKIGLANEEVVNGKCERCGAKVTKKKLKQWMLKITAYAQRLLKDLDKVDYSPRIREQQVNWIGRSEGAEIIFPVVAAPGVAAFRPRQRRLQPAADHPKGEKPATPEDLLKVFTTRPDTLFGATYMVVCPEHEIIKKQELRIKNQEEVKKYIKKAMAKSDLERTDLAKEKTGVQLKGLAAINPVNNKKIPIFVADYVLPHYGTGAIMAVPAHDERDFEFAQKFKLPIVDVIKPKDFYKSYFMEGSFKENPEKELKDFKFTKNKQGGFYVEFKKSQLDHYINIVKKYLKEDYWCEIIGSEKIFIFGGGQFVKVKTEKDAEKSLNLCKKYYDKMKVHYCLSDMLWNCQFYHDLVCFTGEGVMVNSGQFNGMDSKKGTMEIIKWLSKKKLAKKAVNYKLRDWLFSRQHYWGEPIPIVHCDKCGAVPVPEKDLPIRLPAVKKYQPTGTGESPLAAVKNWVNTKCPKCGGSAKRETDTMPNWAGSSWYFLRYCDPQNDKKLADWRKLKYWLPVDLYNGGMEHTTLHLLYSRFWHKFLHRIGLVPTAEPYAKRRSHGVVLAEDSQKMSKSRGNVINPDEMIKRYGADTLRIYEMFMGPFSQMIPWSTQGMIGVRRFLEKVWSLGFKVKSKKLKENNPKPDQDLQTLLHQTIKKVTEDLDKMRFNTAVSCLMILTNRLSEIIDRRDAPPRTPVVETGLVPVSETTTRLVSTRDAYQALLILLAPFAPHIAEELWSQLGNKKSIFLQAWPKYDPKLVKAETFDLIIQINGKVRDKVRAKMGISQKQAEKLAMASEKIKKWIQGKRPKKMVFVKDRLLNLVI